ncbi:MAG: hypothetical protein RL748_3513 [Pseudomonadota bacterium]|jgi:hypothetical protein
MTVQQTTPPGLTRNLGANGTNGTNGAIWLLLNWVDGDMILPIWRLKVSNIIKDAAKRCVKNTLDAKILQNHCLHHFPDTLFPV